LHTGLGGVLSDSALDQLRRAIAKLRAAVAARWQTAHANPRAVDSPAAGGDQLPW
jgi:hypothetical protein